MNRREALFSLGTIAASLAVAPSLSAAELKGVPHETQLSDDHLPKPAIRTGGFLILTASEQQTLGAVFDRLLPADQYGPSATEAGCLEFIDSQLAGDYGSGKALYLEGPIRPENERELMGNPQFLASPLWAKRLLTSLPSRLMTSLQSLRRVASIWVGISIAKVSSNYFCRTYVRAISQIPSMAGTAIWRAGR